MIENKTDVFVAQNFAALFQFILHVHPCLSPKIPHRLRLDGHGRGDEGPIYPHASRMSQRDVNNRVRRVGVLLAAH
jgi:hypothetical protein